MKYSRTALRELTRLYRAVLLAAVIGTVAIAGTANATDVVVGGTYDSGAGTVTGGTVTDLDTLYDAAGAAAAVQTAVDNLTANVNSKAEITSLLAAKADTSSLGTMATKNQSASYTIGTDDLDTWIGTNAATFADVQTTAAVLTDKLTTVQSDLMDAGNNAGSIAHALGGTATTDTLDKMIKDVALAGITAGTANGTINVNGTDLAVTGLGDAAYAAIQDDFTAAAAGQVADAKAVADALDTKVNTANLGDKSLDINAKSLLINDEAVATEAYVDTATTMTADATSSAGYATGDSVLTAVDAIDGALKTAEDEIAKRTVTVNTETGVATITDGTGTATVYTTTQSDAKYVQANANNTFTGNNIFQGTVTAEQGIAVTGGTLTAGATTLGATTVDSLSSSGAIATTGTLAAGDSTLSALSVTNNAEVGGTLDVTGVLSANGGLESTTGTFTGALTSVGLDAGSGAIITTGQATVGSLDAGSGKIQTTGSIEAGDLKTIGALNVGGLATFSESGFALGGQTVTGVETAKITTGSTSVLATTAAVTETIATKADLEADNLFKGTNTFGATTGSQVVIGNNGTITADGKTQLTQIGSTGEYALTVDQNGSTGHVTVNGGLEVSEDVAIDGNLDVNGLFLVDGSTGDTTVGGNLTVSGDTLLANTTVDGTLDVTGDTTVGGALDVTGAATFADTLDVTGATTLGSTLDVTGDTTIGGDLTVSGATTLADTTVDGALEVTGDTTVGGALDVTGAATFADTLDVAGATTLGSTLDVTGDTTVGGDLTVSGATTLADTTVDGALEVTGDTTVGGDLTVAGATTLADTTVDGTLDVTGAATFADTLDVTGAATFADTLDVTGATTLGSTLDITGLTTFGTDGFDLGGNTATAIDTGADAITAGDATTLASTQTVLISAENASYTGDKVNVKSDTIKGAVADLDAAIGDMSGFGSNNVATNTEEVAANLSALDAAIGDLSTLAEAQYVQPDDSIADSLGNLDHSLAKVEHNLGRLENEVRGGFAAAAAMSALVPNARAAGDTQISVGAGNYRDRVGFAVGAFHYVNDNILVNAGAAYGGSKSTTFRAGVTFGW